MVASSVPPVLDGLSATTMDEALLRNEPLLFWYWTAIGWLNYADSKTAVAGRKSTLEVRADTSLSIYLALHFDIVCSALSQTYMAHLSKFKFSLQTQ